MSGRDVRVVFRSTSSPLKEDVAAALALLSPDERARFDRFRDESSAHDFALTHALLRTALSDGTGRAPGSWRFGRTAAGKPFVDEETSTSPAFSLSHTEGLAACAIAPPDVAIGIDVEWAHRAIDVERLASRFFADVEVAAMARLTVEARRRRFFDLWTLKEAAVKAAGLTLPDSLQTFVFSLDDREPRLERSGAAAAVDRFAWQFMLLSPAAGCAGAVAVGRDPGSPPVRIEWPPMW